MESTILRRD